MCRAGALALAFASFWSFGSFEPFQSLETFEPFEHSDSAVTRPYFQLRQTRSQFLNLREQIAATFGVAVNVRASRHLRAVGGVRTHGCTGVRTVCHGKATIFPY
jgi:hypothetical protein